MKIKLVIVLLAFVSQLAWGMDINPTMTGSWYNPQQNGHGLSVEVLDSDTTIIYWYVYDTDGNPIFLVTPATNSGSKASGTTYYFSGMKFGEFDPNDNVQEVWGNATLTIHSCGSATLSYSSTDPAFGSGSIPMQKLASIEGVKCVNNPIQGTYHMTYTDNSEYAVGIMWIFENGYVSLFGLGPRTSISGWGDAVVNSTGQVTANLTIFKLGGGVENDVLSGTFDASTGVINFLESDGEIVGTKYNIFQQALSMSLLADSYTIFDEKLNANIGTLHLLSNGTIDGSTNNGCSLGGEYWIPDGQFNQFFIDMDVSTCVSGSAEVFGTGHRTKLGAAISMDDGVGGYIWALKK